MSDFVLLFTNSKNRIPRTIWHPLPFNAQLQKERANDRVGAYLDWVVYIALRRTRNQQLDLLGRDERLDTH